MKKSMIFYGNLGIQNEDIVVYDKIIRDIKKGIFDEDNIRLLNNQGALKYIIAEGEYDVFKAIIRPYSYEVNGKIRRRYLVDPFSNDIVNFINGAYPSYTAAVEDAQEFGVKDSPDVIVASAVVIAPEDKKKLMDAIYESYPKKDVDMNVIGDVLARQISGWCWPVTSERDIIKYSEISNLYPSLELFNKNIMTTYNDTAGCYEDGDLGESHTEIRIDYDSLDDENKLYADLLVRQSLAKMIPETNSMGISIFTKCNRDEYVGTVSSRMMNVLSGFKKQDMIYGRVTPQEVIDMVNNFTNYLSDETYEKVRRISEQGIDSKGLQQIVDIIGLDYYYDEGENQFWLNEFYYRRHSEFIREQRIVVTDAKLEKKRPSED